MNTGDIGLIINGVVELAAIGALTALGFKVADRFRVVNPVKQPQAGTGAEEPEPVANLDERRTA